MYDSYLTGNCKCFLWLKVSMVKGSQEATEEDFLI